MFNPFKKKKTPKQMAREVMTQSLEIMMLMQDESVTKEEKEAMIAKIKKVALDQGKELVKKAIKEKVITSIEWEKLQSKGLEYSDMHAILLSEFINVDGNECKDHKSIIVTAKGSPQFKNRKFIEKRFNVRIKTGEDLLGELQKGKEKVDKQSYFG